MTHSDADLRDALCVDDSEDKSALPMGNAEIEADEAACDAAREKASAAAETGDWAAALAALTAAIVASSPSPQLYARRAEALLALRRPTAALRDTAAALELNPDSARALRAKGMAHRLLGEWAAASKALGEAQAVDFKHDYESVLKLCVEKAAIVQKRRVVEANAAKLAARREAEEAAAAAAKASAPPPPPRAAAGVVRHVKNESELAALIAEGNRQVIIDFTASWCGPCKMMSPVVDELAKQFSGVTFVKIDVDEAQQLAQKYGVSAMPTFVRLDARGQKVGEFKGADQAALRRMAEEASRA